MDAKTVVFYWAPGLPGRVSSGGAAAVALGKGALGSGKLMVPLTPCLSTE